MSAAARRALRVDLLQDCLQRHRAFGSGGIAGKQAATIEQQAQRGGVADSGANRAVLGIIPRDEPLRHLRNPA